MTGGLYPVRSCVSSTNGVKVGRTTSEKVEMDQLSPDLLLPRGGGEDGTSSLGEEWMGVSCRGLAAPTER